MPEHEVTMPADISEFKSAELSCFLESGHMPRRSCFSYTGNAMTLLWLLVLQALATTTLPQCNMHIFFCNTMLIESFHKHIQSAKYVYASPTKQAYLKQLVQFILHIKI